MGYTVALETPDQLAASWSDLEHLSWNHVFALPGWLTAWWHAFGSGTELYLCAVKEEDTLLGIAPLVLNDKEASFIGSPDVCDYLDFAVAPGRERQFCDILLDDLCGKGASHVRLMCLRPDSTALTSLVAAARDRGHEVSCEAQDVSVEVDLPSTWEEYLQTLAPKQARELRRKLRRLWEAGDLEYQTVADNDAIPEAVDTFLALMRASRKDKAAFMTAERESFFRAATENMARAGLLRFGILQLNAAPVAALTCFDYGDKVYLYNSGYDPDYSYLSVGLLSKALCIKDSIQKGMKVFDFLKGGEVYKYRLGGKEVPIYSCQIWLK
jgi:CelD/BcsL family acetyltransferase involved in cellulose biosynthesis